MRERPVNFKCGELVLEGLLAMPSTPAGERAAVVCHPHPQYGGSMHNNVVEAIIDALQQLGCATLRFNFRGVGRSQGSYGGGLEERNDAAAAVDYMLGLPGYGKAPVVLAGYSFGATVALTAASGIESVKAVVAVAPPLSVMKVSAAAIPTQRLVVAAGDGDSYCPVERLRDLPADKTIVLPGADHFFSGYEEDLTDALVGALEGASL